MGTHNPGRRVGRVVKYKKSRDRQLMGSCKFLPSDGDLCLCIYQSGDRFNNYLIIKKNKKGKWKSKGEFGAYVFGKLVDIKDPSDVAELAALLGTALMRHP